MINKDNEPTEVASLVYFNAGVSKTEALAALNKFMNENPELISSHQTAEYNPNWGCPVWYIP